MFIKGFQDLKLRIPDCHSDSDLWAAELKLNVLNISEIFPYINAQNNQAKYYKNPHYIQFVIYEKRCALYEDKLIIAPFKDREEVIEFIEKLLEYLNDIYKNKDSISPDHDKYDQIPVLGIFKILPRTNCGKCGFPSCMAFSAALSKKETGAVSCPELYKLLQSGETQNSSGILQELKNMESS